jgi:hypothetical protein
VKLSVSPVGWRSPYARGCVDDWAWGTKGGGRIAPPPSASPGRRRLGGASTELGWAAVYPGKSRCLIRSPSGR